MGGNMNMFTWADEGNITTSIYSFEKSKPTSSCTPLTNMIVDPGIIGHYITILTPYLYTYISNNPIVVWIFSRSNIVSSNTYELNLSFLPQEA